jgi:hypothetical protein
LNSDIALKGAKNEFGIYTPTATTIAGSDG